MSLKSLVEIGPAPEATMRRAAQDYLGGAQTHFGADSGAWDAPSPVGKTISSSLAETRANGAIREAYAKTHQLRSPPSSGLPLTLARSAEEETRLWRQQTTGLRRLSKAKAYLGHANVSFDAVYVVVLEARIRSGCERQDAISRYP
eukprot:scaffold7973_cov315-Pinguiococcus_pyrenoidosus.AAC.2